MYVDIVKTKWGSFFLFGLVLKVLIGGQAVCNGLCLQCREDDVLGVGNDDRAGLSAAGHVKQREQAEASMTGNKETDKPLNTMIDKEVRDEKAVKIAIGRIHKGEYKIVKQAPDEELC